MFESVTPLPPDPILGLMAAWRADPDPRKIDLGVGVYKDENGETPVMQAVKDAEARLLANQSSKSYVGPLGSQTFNEQVASLVLGDALKTRLSSRRVTVQTPGGCGGLRLAAEFIARTVPDGRVLVSDPTWANHQPLLGDSGLRLETYPYYDYAAHRIRFEEMMGVLENAGPSDIVLLHGSCHNPCGADLDAEQWQAVCDLALRNGFLPFIDLAYQGLGDGIDEDSHGVRLLAETLPELIVVNSCSKNFGLYRERAGALTLIGRNADSVNAATSRIASIARGIYSMPPDHGASIVATILGDDQLQQAWQQELAQMRRRINGIRNELVEALDESGFGRDFNFIRREKGMFSFLGITPEQVKFLIDEYSIYLVDSSRINVAGLSRQNMSHFVEGLTRALALPASNA